MCFWHNNGILKLARSLMLNKKTPKDNSTTATLWQSTRHSVGRSETKRGPKWWIKNSSLSFFCLPQSHISNVWSLSVTSGAAEHTTVRWGGKNPTKTQSKEQTTSAAPLEASLRLQVSNSYELFEKVHLPTFSCVYQRGDGRRLGGVYGDTYSKSGYVINCPAPTDEYKTECCTSKCFSILFDCVYQINQTLNRLPFARCLFF